jgi:AcrR family transcriptional regulator
VSVETASVRDRIREAADARFRRHGFAKTTMAEIAADCGMSAANLYRYFESKSDLGAAIAERCLTEQAGKLRAVVGADGATAAEKLETFVVEAFDHTYEQIADEPMMAELVQFIARERKDLIREHKMGTLAALVAEILEEGNRTGELDVDDVPATARTVLAATFAFHAPFLILTGLFERDGMEAMARATARLIVRGLAHH